LRYRIETRQKKSILKLKTTCHLILQAGTAICCPRQRALADHSSLPTAKHSFKSKSRDWYFRIRDTHSPVGSGLLAPAKRKRCRDYQEGNLEDGWRDEFTAARFTLSADMAQWKCDFQKRPPRPYSHSS